MTIYAGKRHHLLSLQRQSPTFQTPCIIKFGHREETASPNILQALAISLNSQFLWQRLILIHRLNSQIMPTHRQNPSQLIAQAMHIRMYGCQIGVIARNPHLIPLPQRRVLQFIRKEALLSIILNRRDAANSLAPNILYSLVFLVNVLSARKYETPFSISEIFLSSV